MCAQTSKYDILHLNQPNVGPPFLTLSNIKPIQVQRRELADLPLYNNFAVRHVFSVIRINPASKFAFYCQNL